MDGYGVIVEEIRSCGRTAVTTGEDTLGVDLPGAAGGIEPALPGSASAVAARGLSSMWDSRLRFLGDDVVRLGTDLGAAADRYARDDAAARAGLGAVASRYRRFE